MYNKNNLNNNSILSILFYKDKKYFNLKYLYSETDVSIFKVIEDNKYFEEDPITFSKLPFGLPWYTPMSLITFVMKYYKLFNRSNINYIKEQKKKLKELNKR